MSAQASSLSSANSSAEPPRFTGLLRRFLSEHSAQGKPAATTPDPAKLLAQRATQLQAKRIKRNVEREVVEHQSKKLNWKIFSQGITESAVNYQFAYQNFHQFTQLIKEIAGDEIRAEEWYLAIYTIFYTCLQNLQKQSEAKSILKPLFPGLTDALLRRAFKSVEQLEQWRTGSLNAIEDAKQQAEEEAQQAALKAALSRSGGGAKKAAAVEEEKKSAAPVAAASSSSSSSSNILFIPKTQAAAQVHFMEKEFGAELSFQDPLSWLPPLSAQSVLYDPSTGLAGDDDDSDDDDSDDDDDVIKSTQSGRDVSWVRLNVERLTGKSGVPADEMTLQIARALSSRSDDALQAELFDLLGSADCFDFLIDLLAHRAHVVQSAADFMLIDMPPPALVASAAASSSSSSTAGRGAASGRAVDASGRPQSQARLVGNQFSIATEAQKQQEKQRRKEERRMARRSQRVDETDVSGGARALQVTFDQDRLDQQASMFTQGELSDDPRGFASKLCLPDGTKRTVFKGFEEVYIPPPQLPPKAEEDELVPVSDLDDFAQVVFGDTRHLNRIQTACFHTAYRSGENMLVCAPTGAGKTNVAMLTVLREIGQHVRGGVLQCDDFKIVYVAPMKALAQEVVDKFSRRLAPLGIVVRELTGDMQLTKREIAETQMIVTTPEKWDVVTRKAGDGALVSTVRLLIIDEVHLLHEERGAVIESVVARTLRLVETSQTPVRIVGLSATLPNYADVAVFLRVDPYTGLHFFDSSYRPVPLEQTFIGVTEHNPIRRKLVMNEICFKKVLASVQQGHQVMVFVHSRKETVTTAQFLREQFHEAGRADLISPDEHPTYEGAKQALTRSRNHELKELFNAGLSFHNAGMLRSDRGWVEKYFTTGAIRVLVCTATLAWGVNLPAHTVVIKSTEIYDAKKGGFVELSMLDVMQIFGRAGRPQFDNSGEAILITTHDKLAHYLNLLNHQLPIESTFIQSLENHLNAEIISGTVTNMTEAIAWLSYTYLYVRMLRNPMAYGISYEERAVDPLLLGKRRALLEHCALQLHKCRMVRYDQASGNFFATDLGRVASHYYVHYLSIEVFNEKLQRFMTDEQLLDCIASSREFEQIKIREDEQDELEELRLNDNVCWHEVIGGTAASEASKTNILLQSFISGARIDSFTLISDQMYIMQNSGRIARALFEIALKRGWTYCAARLLDYCKMIERRQWDLLHPLRQFSTLKMEWARKLETKKVSMERLYDMDPADLGVMLGLNTPIGRDIKRLVGQFPRLDVDASVQPITRSVVRIQVTLTPRFRWHDAAHGGVEPFWIWIEDAENEHIYHTEYFLLHKNQLDEPHKLDFTVPVLDPPPSQYLVVVHSDRWLGAKTIHTLSFKHLILPDSHPPHTNLLNLLPLPLSALRNEEYQKLFRFTHFNPVQTQVFHTLYHTDHNVLLGAPTGSGKTITAEIAIFRLMNKDAGLKCVYVAPLKALARERLLDWQVKFGQQLGRRVIELTGDVTPDLAALNAADIIITTPEKWDGISRDWQHRSYVKKVGLVVIDEIHLLGQDRGPVLEVIVSRMRYIAAHTDSQIRVVGLSTALANAHDLADWLGIEGEGLFNFPPSVRPVPLTVHISGFPGKHYCPRMATMNKPTYAAITTYSPSKPVLVFVASRRQTRLTALDLISFLAADDNPRKWLHMDGDELQAALTVIQDSSLRQCLSFGVGLHHAGLQEEDRKTVERLFVEQKIQILVCTSTLAWGVNFPAHLVVIKGTEYFDGKTKRYVDFPITDVLQMMGRAGRPQFDTEGRACILVHEPKKVFYRKFLYEPFPVESSLLEQLHNHINAEIVGDTIASVQDAIDYLTWTYFFRRLVQNPSYYRLDSNAPEAINEFLLTTITRVFDDLQQAGCVRVPESDPDLVEPTPLGRIASFYYLDYTSVALFHRRLSSDLDLPELLSLLTSASEFDELPVRHNEDKVNEELARIVPWPVDGVLGFESPFTKALLLLQCHLSHLPLPVSDYYTDTKSVLDQTIRIANAMVDLAAERGWLDTALKTMNMVQMIVQGRWFHESTLINLPHVSKKVIESLYRKGIECLPELMALSEANCLRALTEAGLGERRANDVYSVVKRLPQIDVDLRVAQPTVTPDGTARLTVQLTRTNTGRGVSGGKTRAYTPFFPKPKDEGYWIVVGRADNRELVALKRVSLMHSKIKTDLTFEVGTTSGQVAVEFYLMSDCYLGLDQQYDFSVNVSG